MYVKECDVAWGSHAKVYSEKEYWYLNTHVMTSWYDAYICEIKNCATWQFAGKDGLRITATRRVLLQ